MFSWPLCQDPLIPVYIGCHFPHSWINTRVLPSCFPRWHVNGETYPVWPLSWHHRTGMTHHIDSPAVDEPERRWNRLCDGLCNRCCCCLLLPAAAWCRLAATEVYRSPDCPSIDDRTKLHFLSSGLSAFLLIRSLIKQTTWFYLIL